ncbi:L-2-amino-thiazoline-4-carboxylic acid hydrolase [Faecalicatena sp. AGMB00832]|uniref:L-2-amino-thiazoline-4-carboxylic acid hydrolase n=1 Tax=Faecalicatena faecalis TaxID=2726362 RepID=A0ABS6D7B9_9FIRM|nr:MULTISPECIES: L-2-amino-thiazoline-4-carboxylic acid hydrolase [Faecalicatena]MBU3877488.1 L-2-amino-thiazoline-4-carboxylic acid hydrolase [Faecalicatena faecalis]MCI6464254.1 L-2-amino-thiazoline-4-carboxylic acid hydrolase [Faecalicatena sp.]MDY5621221.1 L-2-amino-thiazoline-4-carboxylic acid hydrolase [Lachnospiraceae bacterium]
MTTTSPITCTIEHHATLFALLSKYAITEHGEKGKEAILKGMTKYGNERGRRMAQNALAHNDPLNTMTNQAYGEWVPDYPGQIEAGPICIEPTYQTYVSKCAWCSAWQKHDLLEYGKYYCLNVDNAVYQGFRSDLTCRLMAPPLSWGGERCEFDWGHPLTEEEARLLAEKKAELGLSCVKNFTYHTAHILYTIRTTLETELGEAGKAVVKNAVRDYVELFGQEYFDVLDGVYEGKQLP